MMVQYSKYMAFLLPMLFDILQQNLAHIQICAKFCCRWCRWSVNRVQKFMHVHSYLQWSSVIIHQVS